MASLEDDLLKAESIVDWAEKGPGLIEGHFADERHQIRYRHVDRGDTTVDAYTWTTPHEERSFISMVCGDEQVNAGPAQLPTIYGQAILAIAERKCYRFPVRNAS